MSGRRDIVPEPLRWPLLYKISSTTSTTHWKDKMTKDKKLTREGTDKAKEKQGEILNDPQSSPDAKNEAIKEIYRLERAFISQEEDTAEDEGVEATEERDEMPDKPKPVEKPTVKVEDGKAVRKTTKATDKK